MPAGSGLGVAQPPVSTVRTRVAVRAAAWAVLVERVATPPPTRASTTATDSRRVMPIRITFNRSTRTWSGWSENARSADWSRRPCSLAPFDVQDGRLRGAAFERGGAAGPAAGHDEDDGIAARPALTADDLLDHRLQVRRPLVEPVQAALRPCGGRPGDRGGARQPRSDVPRDRLERGRVGRDLPRHGQARRPGGHLVDG